MAETDDHSIWQYAKSNGFVLVSQDADFADIATLFGPPPKLIWLRCGNQANEVVEWLLRNHAGVITAFEEDETAACLQIY